jgi:hypothetical protein
MAHKKKTPCSFDGKDAEKRLEKKQCSENAPFRLIYLSRASLSNRPAPFRMQKSSSAPAPLPPANLFPPEKKEESFCFFHNLLAFPKKECILI